MNIYFLLPINIMNDSLKSDIYTEELKLAEVIYLFKKADVFN